MGIDGPRRDELIAQLAQVIGEEAAAAMSELLPPAGGDPVSWQQVSARFDQVDARFEQLEHRMDGLEHRMDGLEHRMDGLEHGMGRLEHRFDELEVRLDDRFALVQAEMTAVFRGELVAAVQGQTRAFLVALVTILAGTGALAAVLAS
jgi:predicted nuclease with TOPRIM domain